MGMKGRKVYVCVSAGGGERGGGIFLYGDILGGGYLCTAAQGVYMDAGRACRCETRALDER